MPVSGAFSFEVLIQSVNRKAIPETTFQLSGQKALVVVRWAQFASPKLLSSTRRSGIDTAVTGVQQCTVRGVEVHAFSVATRT